MSTANFTNKKLAIYLPSLPFGGIERLYLNLTPLFLKAGLSVTFVLDRADGALFHDVPLGTEVVELGSTKLRFTLPSLIRYLKQTEPDILLTAHRHKNIIGIWADLIARTRTCHIASIHTPLSVEIKLDESLANFMLPFFHRVFLRWAGCVVAVSNGVATDISSRYYRKEKIRIIQNGVTTENFSSLVNENFEHPWLCENRPMPTFVAAGRLGPQKDFPTLIKGFAEFRKTKEAKLIIFGEGSSRAELQTLSESLNVSEHLDMPGFIQNIFPAMRKSSAFILSSAFEGFGLVVAEALACGTPVISTDCPYGPAEILDHGKYGSLIPVGDWRQLSEAMHKILISHPTRETLCIRGQSFSVSRCAEQYLDLFKDLIQ